MEFAKTKLVILLFSLFPSALLAQEKGLKELDVNLSNYQYRFEVEYLNLDIQTQELQTEPAFSDSAADRNTAIIGFQDRQYIHTFVLL